MNNNLRKKLKKFNIYQIYNILIIKLPNNFFQKYVNNLLNLRKYNIPEKNIYVCLYMN